jgi:hypothetical protein
VFADVANQVRTDILAVHDLPAEVLHDPIALARVSSAGYLRVRVDNRELLTVIGHQALDDAEIADIWQEIRDRPVGRTARHINELVAQGKAKPAASAVAIAHATYGVADRFAELVVAKPKTFDQRAAELSDIYLRLLGIAT